MSAPTLVAAGAIALSLTVAGVPVVNVRAEAIDEQPRVVVLPSTQATSPLTVMWTGSPTARPTLFRLTGGDPMMLTRRNISTSSVAEVNVDAAIQGVSAISKRIAHLRTLGDGWIGDHSLAPNSGVLAWLEQHTSELDAVRGISLIPMEDGSVALRWMAGALDITAEVRPDWTLYTLVDDVESDGLEEHIEPLTDSALAAFLNSHASA